MVASHTAAAAVNKNIRCKPDEVIRAIADTGMMDSDICRTGLMMVGEERGVSRVCLVPEMLAWQPLILRPRML